MNDLTQILHTILVGVSCNVACALLGCYLVLRRISLIGDAISHAVLPGIALAFILTHQLTGWPIVLGAMLVGVLTSFLTQTFHQLGKVPEDASMGVVFSALFALGVIMVHTMPRADLDANCVLYGRIEFVPVDLITVPGITAPPFLQALFPVDAITGTGIMVPRVMQTIGPILLLTIGFIALLWKELKIAAFDPALATSMGLNATVVHYLLMAMVSGVTVASFEAVGAILVVAMLIVPAATAQLLSDRLRTMLGWSAATAGLAAVAGGILGPVLDTSIAGMMAVSAGFFFLLAVLFAPRHGMLSKVIRNARLALRIAGEDILGHLYRFQEVVALQRPAEEIDRLDAVGRATGHGLIGRLAMLDLKRQGLLQVEDRGPGLTEKGRRRAESIVRAHRLWETYMEKDFALPIDHVHDPAERMEHYLGPDLQTELAAQLGEPAVDPHGRQIPPAG